MPKRILITGLGGFIGSAIARQAIRHDYQVVGIDDFSTGFPHNVPAGCHCVRGDISRRKDLDALPNDKVEVVLHLAAQSSGEISHENPARDMEVNAIGTLNLLDWCLRHGVKRFIFASSMVVYGEQSLGIPVPESASCRPKSFYGLSKLTSEHLLRIYEEQHGIQWTALRLFNVYGPGQDLGNMKQGMVSIYLAFLLQNQPITVKGSLDRYRDQIYIDDVVEAWLRCLENPTSIGKILNVGTGKPTTVREITALLLKHFNKEDDPAALRVDGKTPGDLFGIFADVKRLHDVLGFEAKISFADGLAKMVEWARGVRK